MQVKQRVHLDGGLVLAEFRPTEQGEAQVDGGRIQRVQALSNSTPIGSEAYSGRAIPININTIISIQTRPPGVRGLHIGCPA